MARNRFVTDELRRVRALYGQEAANNLIVVEPNGGAKDANHGWYPAGQKAADELLQKTLRP